MFKRVYHTTYNVCYKSTLTCNTYIIIYTYIHIIIYTHINTKNSCIGTRTAGAIATDPLSTSLLSLTRNDFDQIAIKFNEIEALKQSTNNTTTRRSSTKRNSIRSSLHSSGKYTTTPTTATTATDNSNGPVMLVKTGGGSGGRNPKIGLRAVTTDDDDDSRYKYKLYMYIYYYSAAHTLY